MNNGDKKKQREKLPSLSKEQIKKQLSEWLENHKPKQLPARKAYGVKPAGLSCYAPFGASGVQNATSLSQQEFIKEKKQKRKIKKLRALKRQKIRAIKKEIERRNNLPTEKKRNNKSYFSPKAEFKKKLRYYGMQDLKNRLAFLTSELDEKE